MSAVSTCLAEAAPMPLLLHLDQNYLSGMVKLKPAFRELEPALRAAVARGAVAVPEAEAHGIESAARPDLPLLELLRDLSRELHFDVLPVLVPRTRADGQHAAALRLLLGGVRQDDPAHRRLLLLENLDDQAVIKRLQIHEKPP